MPIEREFKYLLRSPEELWARLTPVTTSGLIVGRALITQAYLGRGGRIRKRQWSVYRGEVLESPKIENIFTYKYDLTSQPGCLEMEMPMSEDDFQLAWSEADHRLEKTRFMLPCNNSAGVWEVDFFHDAEGIYLAMAEFEVPALAGPPDRLHPLVREYLTYSVPEDDGRFKNRKLGDRKNVEKLLKEIV